MKPYKSTPIFDENSVPDALQRAHSTKEGIWGLLEVSSGRLDYIDEETGDVTTLSGGDHQIISPQRLHHVKLDGPITMQVHFFKQRPQV